MEKRSTQKKLDISHETSSFIELKISRVHGILARLSILTGLQVEFHTIRYVERMTDTKPDVIVGNHAYI